MPSITDNVGTFVLSGESITLIQEWGVRSVSVKLVSGTVTVQGTKSLGVRTPDPIPVTEENPINVGFDFPIDGYTIDASAGVAEVITGQ